MCLCQCFRVAFGVSCPRQIVRGWLTLAIVLLSACGASRVAWATSGTWSLSAATPGAWQTTTNWVGGIVPGATSGITNTDTATFNSSTGFTSVVPDLGRNLKNITFDTLAAPYTIGTTGGSSLLLTSGGTTQITSTFSGSNMTETINAPLVLEGNYTLADNCTNSGVLLDVGGAISTAGNPLTLSGPGSISVSGNISGVGSVSKTGSGTVFLSGTNTYSGGTTVTGGILLTNTLGDPASPTTVSAAAGVNSALVLGASPQGQTVGSLAGTVAPLGSAVVSIGGDDTVTVNQATNTTFGGTIGLSGTLIKSGAGTLEITGAPALSNLSSIQVTSGGLRFNVASGSPFVGTGVTTTVNNGATLELAGSVSTLSNGSNRVNITNDSRAAAGILVSGTHQQVGNIDGSGTTQVNAGASLTADRIIQGSLIIGGTSGSHALVTIDASDASGNPLDVPSGLAVADSLTPSEPFGAGESSSANVSSVGQGADVAAESLGNSVGSDPSPVPEPSTLLLALLAFLGVVGTQFARYYFQCQTA